MKKHVEMETMVVDVSEDDIFYDDIIFEHRAKKTFSSIVEAIDSAMAGSYSLSGSDISVLRVNTLDEAVTNIKKYRKEAETSILPTIETIGNSISYTTVSGVNFIKIEVLEDNNCEAVYGVKSKRPLGKSSVMKNFKKNGWDCFCESAPYAILHKTTGYDYRGYSFKIEANDTRELSEKIEEISNFEIERFTYNENLYEDILRKLGIEGYIKGLEPIFDERTCVGYYAPDFRKNTVVISMVVYAIHEGDTNFRGWIRIEDSPYEVRWLEGLRFGKPVLENGEEDIYGVQPIRESFHRNLSSSRY